MPKAQKEVHNPGASWERLTEEKNILSRYLKIYFVICALCGKVEIGRSFESYIWFDHKKLKDHRAEKFNNTIKKTLP